MKYEFNVTNPTSKSFRHITCDGKSVHFISNVDDFLVALGYTTSHARSGLLFDEFIWEEFTREGALRTHADLQSLIVAYLRKHCSFFSGK